MTKREREKEVEKVLKRWRQIQDEIKAVEQDAAAMAFSQGAGEPVQSSSVSDKTARGAFLLESIGGKKAWVQCVKESMEWLHEEQPNLHQLLFGHYWLWNKKGYTRSHARMFMDYYCMEHHVSERQYHRMRIDALDEVVFTATEKGLFNAAVNREKA